MAQDSPRVQDGQHERVAGDGQAPPQAPHQPDDLGQQAVEAAGVQLEEEEEGVAAVKDETDRMLPEGATDEADTATTVTTLGSPAEQTPHDTITATAATRVSGVDHPALQQQQQPIGKRSANSTPDKKGRHPVAAGRPLLGFLRRLLGRDKQQDEEDKSKDPEAGTELLDASTIRHSDGADTQPSNGGRSADKAQSERADEVVELATEDNDDRAAAQPSGKDVSMLDRVRQWPRGRALAVAGTLLLLCLLVLAVALVVARADNSSAAALPPGGRVLASTTCGPVLGAVEDGALAFRGIPYAAPPVNEARWRPSEPASRLEDCWTGTLDARNHSALCWQKPLPHPNSGLRFSEDCLRLDVYTPRVTYDEPMAVVVYFAGDSFLGHDSMDFEWRPSALLARQRQVVFVVVYYRMSALGFLSLELLTRHAHPPTSGNYGLHDMLTALKWVQRNVENFGGSASRVTVLGNGSGATAILALMSSRLAHLLFSQAWITGGSAHFVNKTLKESERNNEAFNRHLMCDSAECLYAKTPEEILAAVPSSEWPFWGVPNHLRLPTSDEHVAAVAVVDGAVLYDVPSTVWDNEDFVDVTLVIGSALDSVGAQLSDEEMDAWDWSAFNRSVTQALRTFGGGAEQWPLPADAIQRYYRSNGSAVGQYVRMLSDLRVTCPLLHLAYRASKLFSNNVYFYVAAHAPDGRVEHANLSGHRLAVHGLEVAAIFGVLPRALGAHLDRAVSERDLRFQSTVQDTFYHFVEHGRLAADSERNFRMPWHINWMGETMESRQAYEDCQFWKDAGMYPRHARMN